MIEWEEATMRWGTRTGQNRTQRWRGRGDTDMIPLNLFGIKLSNNSGCPQINRTEWFDYGTKEKRCSSPPLILPRIFIWEVFTAQSPFSLHFEFQPLEFASPSPDHLLPFPRIWMRMYSTVFYRTFPFSTGNCNSSKLGHVLNFLLPQAVYFIPSLCVWNCQIIPILVF